MHATQQNRKILFIYNANSGFANTLLDVAHKMVSPSTYSCSLCSLTYGVFTERPSWKRFKRDLTGKGYALEFLHKDEFLSSYKSKFGHKFEYPIVLLEENGFLDVLVQPLEINSCKNAPAFIEVIKRRL